MKILLIVVVIALIIAWFFLRQHQSKKTDAVAADRRASETDNSYHAVSIRFTTRACAAAKELDGRRFLSSAAPGLPLAECDADKCSCHYSHHSDRREREDRRNPYGAARFGGAMASSGKDRRDHHDRRDDTGENKTL